MSHSQVSIRRATAADAAGILKCLAVAFEPYRQQYTPEGFRDTTLTRETIQQRLEAMSVYVAVDEWDGANVVGTIGCSVIAEQSGSAEGHIRGMAVLPEWQGRGVAEQLLAAVEQELRARGCDRITLDTTRPLQRAMRFYEKHGYRHSGKVSDFFGMPLFEYVKDPG
jgi:GNAT superfamily N-acetyltransferase